MSDKSGAVTWIVSTGSLRVSEGSLSGGFSNLAGLDAVCANLHALRATLRQLDPNRLQIWIKPTRRSIICVRDIIAELRTFPADFATFSHYFYETSKGNQPNLVLFSCTVQLIGKIENQDL